MPSHDGAARITHRRWRKILAPLVIGPTVAIAGLALGSGSASAACSVSDGILQRTAPSVRDDNVRCLQQSLHDHGVDAGPVDGWFGPVTQAAVSRFQATHGLTVDGWMGRQTRTALGIERSGSSSHVASSTQQAPHRRHRATSSGSNFATGSTVWDRIAQCESGGNWAINTGNGYYGGLQFNYNTWLSVNGDDFASRADMATRAEQITVANRLYAKRGLQPWGCRHAA